MSGLGHAFPTPPEPNDDTGVGPAPTETIALLVTLIATMGPDEIADFEERTFRQWDRFVRPRSLLALDRCGVQSGEPNAVAGRRTPVTVHFVPFAPGGRMPSHSASVRTSPRGSRVAS